MCGQQARGSEIRNYDSGSNGFLGNGIAGTRLWPRDFRLDAVGRRVDN
jgi:hypothetical protein